MTTVSGPWATDERATRAANEKLPGGRAVMWLAASILFAVLVLLALALVAVAALGWGLWWLAGRLGG